jgi:hypothetical protein
VVLGQTLDPTVADANWLLSTSELTPNAVSTLLRGLLHGADDRQLSTLVADAVVGDEVIRQLETDAPDLIRRAILAGHLPVDVLVNLVRFALPTADTGLKAQIADSALHQSLGVPFEGDDIGFLVTILGIVGSRLDGAWAARAGLGQGIPASVASRNLRAFHKAAQPARLRIVQSIEEVAKALCDRRKFELGAPTAEACAQLLLEAERAAPIAALNAAGRILPMLMRQRGDPVSPLIAAAFPIVYREYAKKDDVPDFLKIIPFMEWDRCKAARHELVSAFIASSWAPGDLALIACRCTDVGKILRRAAKSYGGGDYINRVAADTKRLPDPCRKSVERAISTIKSDWSAKYDWRD